MTSPALAAPQRSLPELRAAILATIAWHEQQAAAARFRLAAVDAELAARGLSPTIPIRRNPAADAACPAANAGRAAGQAPHPWKEST